MSRLDYKGRFRELCAELTRSLLPALTSRGYAAPADSFSRTVLGYDFRRSTPVGTHTFSVLFNKYRYPQFGVQLFIEPIEGLAELQSRGGQLLIGNLSASPVFWPMGVRPFRASSSWLQRILRHPPPTPSTAVQSALALMPEVEQWWKRQQSSRHILTGRLKYAKPPDRV